MSWYVVVMSFVWIKVNASLATWISSDPITCILFRMYHFYHFQIFNKGYFFTILKNGWLVLELLQRNLLAYRVML